MLITVSVTGKDVGDVIGVGTVRVGTVVGTVGGMVIVSTAGMVVVGGSSDSWRPNTVKDGGEVAGGTVALGHHVTSHDLM